MKAGLQLYSINEETKKDMIGSLKRVAEIGYDSVEFAGYGHTGKGYEKRCPISACAPWEPYRP